MHNFNQIVKKAKSMYFVSRFDGHSWHLALWLVGRVALAEGLCKGGESVDKVEGGSAEQHREDSHSVGNLGGMIQVLTFAKEIQTSSETEKA